MGVEFSIMDLRKLKIPSTQHEAFVNLFVAGLQVGVGSNITKPTARDREALEAAKANLYINAAPIVLPIAGAILRDVVTEIAKLFQPRPQYIAIGPRQPVVLLDAPGLFASQHTVKAINNH